MGGSVIPIPPQADDYSALYDQQQKQDGQSNDWSALYDAQRPAAKPVGTPTAIMDTMGNMAMFGAAPKLSGAIAGIQAKLKGQDYTPAYESERDRAQQMLDSEAAQLGPWTRRAASVGGAILNPANEALSGIGSFAGRAMGAFGKTMLGRAIAQGAIPGALGGAGQAIGSTVGSPGDYARSTLLQSLMGSAAGGVLGAAGQVAGKWNAARAGARAQGGLYDQAHSAELYDEDLPKGYIDRFLNAVSGNDPERPFVADAYQLAAKKAASTGKPLPPLPLWNASDRAAEALRGRAGQASPMPAGLSLRIVDETKRALNALARAPGGGHLADVENAYYRDFVNPVKAAVPEYAEALAAHTDIEQNREFGEAVSPASSKNLASTIAGGAIGAAAGHPIAGIPFARIGTALAQTPAARDATAGLPPQAAQVLSPAVGQLVSMLLARRASGLP